MINTVISDISTIQKISSASSSVLDENTQSGSSEFGSFLSAEINKYETKDDCGIQGGSIHCKSGSENETVKPEEPTTGISQIKADDEPGKDEKNAETSAASEKRLLISAAVCNLMNNSTTSGSDTLQISIMNLNENAEIEEKAVQQSEDQYVQKISPENRMKMSNDLYAISNNDVRPQTDKGSVVLCRNLRLHFLHKLHCRC